MLKIINSFVIIIFSFFHFNGIANAALVDSSTLLMNPNLNNYWAWDINSDLTFSIEERTAIEPGLGGGITLGNTQNIGEIDAAWNSNSVTGYHYTNSPITIVSDDNSGNIELDIYGFRMLWDNEHYSFDSVKDPTGTLTCGNTCENGDSFVLDIIASLPCADCFYRGRHDYMFHMEGTISAVPVPSALWLFSSGLIGLVGFCRRIKPNVKNT